MHKHYASFLKIIFKELLVKVDNFKTNYFYSSLLFRSIGLIASYTVI